MAAKGAFCHFYAVYIVAVLYRLLQTVISQASFFFLFTAYTAPAKTAAAAAAAPYTLACPASEVFGESIVSPVS